MSPKQKEETIELRHDELFNYPTEMALQNFLQDVTMAADDESGGQDITNDDMESIVELFSVRALSSDDDSQESSDADDESSSSYHSVDSGGELRRDADYQPSEMDSQDSPVSSPDPVSEESSDYYEAQSTSPPKRSLDDDDDTLTENPPKRLLVSKVLSQKIIAGELYFAVECVDESPVKYDILPHDDVLGTFALATFKREKRLEDLKVYRQEILHTDEAIPEFTSCAVDSIGQLYLRSLGRNDRPRPILLETAFELFRPAVELFLIDEAFMYPVIHLALFYFFRDKLPDFGFTEKEFLEECERLEDDTKQKFFISSIFERIPVALF